MPDNYFIGLMSFVAGVLIGLTSMGGAALMTPFLVLVAGMRPVLAVGTDLVYSAVTKIAGAAMHCRHRTVDFSTALRLASGSVPGGMLGVLAIFELRRSGIDADAFVRRGIGLALLTVAVILLLHNFYLKVDAIPGILKSRRNTWLAGWGALVGFGVGFTSVGSGSLMAPFLLLLYPRSPARMVGTDIFHSALLVSATAVLHAGFHDVQWPLLVPLWAGAIPGVLLGSHFAPRLPPRLLRIGLGVVLFATGLKLV